MSLFIYKYTQMILYIYVYSHIYVHLNKKRYQAAGARGGAGYAGERRAPRGHSAPPHQHHPGAHRARGAFRGGRHGRG